MWRRGSCKNSNTIFSLPSKRNLQLERAIHNQERVTVAFISTVFSRLCKDQAACDGRCKRVRAFHFMALDSHLSEGVKRKWRNSTGDGRIETYH